MTIPEAAAEAAAEAMSGTIRLSDFPGAARDFWMKQGLLAIEAAMPAIREALAQEIEAQGREAVKWLAEHRVDATDMGRLIGTEDAYKDAIRIARGEKYGLDDLVGGTP